MVRLSQIFDHVIKNTQNYLNCYVIDLKSISGLFLISSNKPQTCISLTNGGEVTSLEFNLFPKQMAKNFNNVDIALLALRPLNFSHEEFFLGF